MRVLVVSLWVLLNIRAVWSIEKSAATIKPMNVENASRIIEKVLKGYYMEIGPIIGGKPINVEVNLFINDMVPIKKADLHFSIDCYLRVAWTDPRLAFNASKDVFIPYESTFAREIWTPNLYFPNGKSGYIHPLTKPNIFVKVHADGRVFFSERISLISFCPMNMTYYPFDIQRCHVTIEDYSYPIEYLRLRWMSPATEKATDLYSADFYQVKLDVGNTTRKGDFNHTFDRLTVEISLYRDIKLYILRDFLPCILIVIMSWITFWINHKSIPARVCLGITTVLTIVSMTNNIRNINPDSNELRSIDVFLLICLLFVFGALFELALTGMTDAKGSTWWRNKRKKDVEDKAAKAEDALKENEAEGTVLHVNENMDGRKGGESTNGTNSSKVPKKLSLAHCSRLVIGYKNAVAEMNPKTETPVDDDKNKFLGPFVFLHGDPHIVDSYAKIFFPSLFIMFILVFFLFHNLNPHTVGGSNA